MQLSVSVWGTKLHFHLPKCVCLCVCHQGVNVKSQPVCWPSAWSSTLRSQRLWAVTSSARRSVSVCGCAIYSSASLIHECNKTAVNERRLSTSERSIFLRSDTKAGNIRASMFSAMMSLCFPCMQQSLERQRTAEKERLFLVYAKQWWREFLEIRPSHQSKMVKIFAQVHLKISFDERN